MNQGLPATGYHATMIIFHTFLFFVETVLPAQEEKTQHTSRNQVSGSSGLSRGSWDWRCSTCLFMAPSGNMLLGQTCKV